MKLHLPKLLLTAVLAASCTAYAAEQWGKPQFGGPEYTWTGAGDGSSYTDGANWQENTAPDRANNNGPTLIFNGATATITGANKNSSDRGGIKALNGSNVSVGLGDWGGSIYVEEGSALTTNVGIQLKNTEQSSNANVYAGGKLTITNTTLDFLDGNNWQNWQIDTNGQIDLTAMTEVKKQAGGWNLQYILPEHVTIGSPINAGTVSNRDYESKAVEKQIVTSAKSLAGMFDSVTVIDTMRNSAANADMYEMTYGENGNLTVSYTEEKYNNASLETSGDITWAHGSAGWVIAGADTTDTSFLNGDTVKFAGNGSANLQGDITVNDLTVGEGVDYTVNMSNDSSLYIQTRKDNFGGLKIVGNDSTSLGLRLSTDATHNGDSRVMLAEGSSLGAVYVDGVFAYNLHGGALQSNLGGADLHLGNNGVLLLRNGLSGTVDANIKDIYFDGNNGEIRTYGNVTDATVADNIYASALQKTDTGSINLSGTVNAQSIIAKDGTLTLAGTVNAKSIIAKGGTLTLAGTVKSTDSLMAGGGNINITGTVTTGQLRLSEQGVGNVTISTGGKLSVTGTNNNHSTGTSMLLAHWGHDSKLTIAGGELDAQNTTVLMSWTGTGTLEITSGIASVKGLNFWAQGTALKGHLILGSETGGTGRLNIGSDGIIDACGNAPSVKLGNGTIGATADWRAKYNGSFTATVFQLVGTEGGTVFDTTDANDGTTARTIIIDNPMAGSGKLVKTGDGILELKGDNSYSGGTTITGGTLKATHQNALGTGSVTVNGGNLEVTGEHAIKGAELNITNGKVTATINNGNVDKSVISNDTKVNIGTDGTLVLSGHDMVGWGGGKAPSIILGSTDTTKKAVLDIQDTSSCTFGSDVTMNGNSEIKGTSFNTFDFSLAVTGTGNSITAEIMQLRNNLSIEVDQSAELTINSKLTNGNDKTGNITKSGLGSLIITNSESDWEGALNVTQGVLELRSAATLNTVVMSSNTSLISGDGTIKSLTLESGAELQADSAVAMADGSSLSLGIGLTLNGDLLDAVKSLTGNKTVDLFTNVGTLTLGTEVFTQGSNVLDATNAIDLSKYFALVTAQTPAFLSDEQLSSGYYLGFDANGTVYAGLIPEPTTATLSLLALAALAARRRRK